MIGSNYGNPFCQETGTSIISGETFCSHEADSENYVEKGEDVYKRFLNLVSNHLFQGSYSLFLQPIIDTEKISFRKYFRQPLSDHHSDDKFRYRMLLENLLEIYSTNVSDFYIPKYYDPIEEKINILSGEIDILTKEAINELKANFSLLMFLSGTFLRDIKQRIIDKNFEYELVGDVFYDIEVENWKTMNFVIKIKNYESMEYQQIKDLWESLVLIKLENLRKLKEQLNLSDEDILELKNLFVIIMEPY